MTNLESSLNLAFEIEGLLLLLRERGMADSASEDDVPAAEIQQLLREKVAALAENLGCRSVEEGEKSEPTAAFCPQAEKEDGDVAKRENVLNPLAEQDLVLEPLTLPETEAEEEPAAEVEEEPAAEAEEEPEPEAFDEPELEPDFEPEAEYEVEQEVDQTVEATDDSEFDELANSLEFEEKEEADEPEEADESVEAEKPEAVDEPVDIDELLDTDEPAETDEEYTRNPVFTLNDRFRFRRELFSNSDSEMADALNVVGSMRSFDEAEEYFYTDLCWDPENPDVADFMSIIRDTFK